MKMYKLHQVCFQSYILDFSIQCENDEKRIEEKEVQ